MTKYLRQRLHFGRSLSHFFLLALHCKHVRCASEAELLPFICRVEGCVLTEEEHLKSHQLGGQQATRIWDGAGNAGCLHLRPMYHGHAVLVRLPCENRSNEAIASSTRDFSCIVQC